MKKAGRKIFLVAFCAITGFGIYRLGAQVFGAQQFHFSLDPQLSRATQKAIKEAVYESYVAPLASLCEKIHNVCPAVEQISVERCANNKIYIAVQSKRPYVCIDEYVLTCSGALVEKFDFEQKATVQLPIITQKNLLGKVTITDEFKQWLLQLDPSVFAFYEITRTDDYTIELKNKNNNQQSILCSVCTAPDKSLRELCQRIMDEKIAVVQGTARKYCYTADVRFEKQIIICSHKGGACNG